MPRFPIPSLLWHGSLMPIASILFLAWSGGGRAAVDDGADDPASRFAEHLLALTDAVREHHVDSPSRVQVLRSGLQSLAEESGVDLGPWKDSLTQGVGKDRCREVLCEAFAAARTRMEGAAVERTTVQAAIHALPGYGTVIAPDVARIQASLSANA